MEEPKKLIVEEASENNLKNITVEIPHNSLTCITGVSGSGKTSLAIDTIYAEGQLRYIESFSPYIRQFLERVKHPDVKAIKNIPPAIAIKQHNPIRSSRSTVGTITEINDYLKLLYARASILICPTCKREVKEESTQDVVEFIENLKDKSYTFILITFPYQFTDNPEIAIKSLLRQGFRRIYINGRIINIERTLPPSDIEWEVVISKFNLTDIDKDKLIDSIELAFKFGNNRVNVITDDGNKIKFSKYFTCSECGREFKKPDPNLFTYNSPYGACETCKGFGNIIEIDEDKVIPDKELSLKEGAIKPLTTPAFAPYYQEFLYLLSKRGIPIDIPYKELPDDAKKLIWQGDPHIWGINDFFDWVKSKSYKTHLRILLSKYRSYKICPECRGSRLKKEALNFYFESYNIYDLWQKSISELEEFFHTIKDKYKNRVEVNLLIKEINSRLQYLTKIGLGYLTLHRESRTLSGGELQRIMLTTALGSSLVHTLFVLDEPTIGLHPIDTINLLKSIEQLKRKNNTIIVVEHDPTVIANSDYIIDLGPGPGNKGGNIVFAGDVKSFLNCKVSLTSQYLTGKKHIPTPKQRIKPSDWLIIKQANLHNIHNQDFKIPLGLFLCITGPSGSGKSTLIIDILYNCLQEKIKYGKINSSCCKDIIASKKISKVVLIDQKPLHTSVKVTVVTYLHIFDEIRKLMSKTELAKELEYTPGHFSYNSPIGQCPHCKGAGYIVQEMQFLADQKIICPVCEGKRYKPEILNIKFKGKNIVDILDLTVEEAISFFKDNEKITKPLKLLKKFGLGYLKLGQRLTELSGGENQRLKLASISSTAISSNTLLIMDEPTIGLHFDDINKLINVLLQLRNQCAGIIAIEHNMEFVKCADYIIDLGPGSGEEGGKIVAHGTPEEITAFRESKTALFLKQSLTNKAFQLLKKRTLKLKNIPDNIVIKGAREHNLKNLSLSIPNNKFVVITGVSGSGKSTLAYDIICAEGQRYYLSTLSNYAKQFIKQLQKPDVDLISGIPPTISIEQKKYAYLEKSTLGTITNIYPYLRLLYSKLGISYCPNCHQQTREHNLDELIDFITTKYNNQNITITAPIVKGRKGTYRHLFEKLVKKGFKKAIIDNKLTDISTNIVLERSKLHSIDLIIKRVHPIRERKGLREALELAISLGKNSIGILTNSNSLSHLNLKNFCLNCNLNFPELEPRLFSFNSYYGYCKECFGLGYIHYFEPEYFIHNYQLNLKQGAIPIIKNKEFYSFKRKLLSYLKRVGIDVDKPLKDFTGKELNLIFYGDKNFKGLISLLNKMLIETNSSELRELILSYRKVKTCPHCQGLRLNKYALNVKIKGITIGEWLNTNISQLDKLIDSIKEESHTIMSEILPEIEKRIKFLKAVGLDYLNLNRSVSSLSVGELQRARISAQLSSNLTGVCYILDEPTIGLHRIDHEKLVAMFKKLVKAGNSLIVVEHDDYTITNADYIVDLGPGGGKFGGKLLFRGSVPELLKSKKSITAKFLRKKNNIPLITSSTSFSSSKFIEIKGARKYNLKNINVKIPLNSLVCITGPSGAGKSTLLIDILYKYGNYILKNLPVNKKDVDDISGLEAINSIKLVDSSPIGRNPSSVPATYVGIFDEIRKIFSLSNLAKIRGYTISRFSFNLKEGQCNYCKGQGIIKLKMQFLPDLFTKCPICKGRRYNEETLEVTFKEKNIYDVLNMSVQEAYLFFQNFNKIKRILKFMIDLGLDYINLGQPSYSLSGGESQRIKLVRELGAYKSNNLIILDEPTTGLHFADLYKLIKSLKELVNKGNTVIVIEHNLHFIANSDYIIDLGPGGGIKGGYVVAQGTPRDILKFTDKSHTAKYLHQLINHS